MADTPTVEAPSLEVYLTADHNGLALKDSLRDWLDGAGYHVIDMGPTELDPTDDYPDFGIAMARTVAEAPEMRVGIAVCGSGVGMAVVADKVPGVRAGLIHDPEIAMAAKRDDNINVLALGARYLTFEQAQRVVRAWLEASFSGEERHVRRIAKIAAYEASTT